MKTENEMKNNYEINEVEKQFLEKLPIPLVVYETNKNNKTPLVLTEGALKLFGKSREELLNYLKNNLFNDMSSEDSIKLEDFIKFGKEFNAVVSLKSNEIRLNMGGRLQKKMMPSWVLSHLKRYVSQ